MTRLRPNIAVAIVFWTVGMGAVTSQGQVDDSRLREVEKLIIRPLKDTAGDLDSLTEAQLLEFQKAAEEQERRRLAEIRTRPGLTPLILALVDRYSEGGDSGGIGPVLIALSMRTDVPAARFDQIKMKIREMLGRTSPTVDRFALQYMIGGVYVLATKPSAESEDLIIRIMDSRDDAFGLNLKRPAAEALGRTGTERCLPALEKARDWVVEVTRNTDQSLYEVPPMEAAVRAVKARVNSSKPADSPPTSAGAKQGTLHLSDPAFPQAADDARSVALRRLVWALIMAAAMGLIWMALKRRK